MPHGVSERGQETVAVCGLDRPNLLDLYIEHVVHFVRPKLETLFAADRQGNDREVIKAWNGATRGLLAPARPFRALSHDALRVLVPTAIRARCQLRLERPQP